MVRRGLLGAMGLLAACTTANLPAAPALQADFASAAGTAEPRPPPGARWHASARPAVLQTVVRPRQPVWFRIPCPEDGVDNPSFVASLQRALKARGFYGAAVTGVKDAATDAAVLRYQSANGLDNAVLSRVAAQALGLVPVGP